MSGFVSFLTLDLQHSLKAYSDRGGIVLERSTPMAVYNRILYTENCPPARERYTSIMVVFLKYTTEGKTPEMDEKTKPTKPARKWLDGLQ